MFFHSVEVCRLSGNSRDQEFQNVVLELLITGITNEPVCMDTTQLHIVNKPFQKVEGKSLVTGSARYTDDFTLPGMLHAKLLLSPHPHAKIMRINTEKAEALPGVHAVLTYKDITPVRHSTAGQSWPEPSPYDRLILAVWGNVSNAAPSRSAGGRHAALPATRLLISRIAGSLPARKASKLLTTQRVIHQH